MFNIVIEPGDRKFSVNVSIDMTEYCTLAKHIDGAQEQTESEYMEPFSKEYQNYVLQLSELAGDLHWNKIKRTLAEQCDDKRPEEIELARSLLERERLPLVIQALDSSFIETLKNSMDAKIKQFVSKASEESTCTLKIHIFLELKDEITVTITDNAGGFTADYLESFSIAALSGEDVIEPFHSEKEKKNIYFGGAALGLKHLSRMMRGRWGNAGEEYHSFVVSPGATSIEIRNNPLMKGAEIFLRSPRTPAMPMLAPVPSTNSLEEDSVAHGYIPLSPSFTLKLPTFFPTKSVPEKRSPPHFIAIPSRAKYRRAESTEFFEDEEELSEGNDNDFDVTTQHDSDIEVEYQASAHSL